MKGMKAKNQNRKKGDKKSPAERRFGGTFFCVHFIKIQNTFHTFHIVYKKYFIINISYIICIILLL